MISESVFHFCEFFIFWAVWGIKGKSKAQNEKITIAFVICHILGTVQPMIMIFGTLELNGDISRIFFLFFFLIFIFQAVMGVKGQKIAQDDKKSLSGAHCVSLCIIWFSFTIFMFKMLIYTSRSFFHFFKKIFSGLLGGKRVKNSPKWHKILSAKLDISGTIHHMIIICGTAV